MNCNSLSEIKDIHKGHRAIIMGAGWSLTEIPLKRESNDIIFACNQAVTSIEHCNYFCMTDGATSEANFFEYGVNISDKVVLFGSGFFKSPTVLRMYDSIKHKTYFIERRYYNKYSNDFNLDDGFLIWGADVVQTTCNLAHVMGCDPLILIGVDLNYKLGQKYCINTKLNEKVKWSDSQGYGNNLFYSHLPSGDDDPELGNSFNVWLSIKKENNKINFLCANPYSRLANLFKIYEG